MIVVENAACAWINASILSFGALALMPLARGAVGIFVRIQIAAVFGFYLSSSVSFQPKLSVGLAAAEIIVGILAALPVALMLSGCMLFGELIDAGRGQNIGSLYDAGHEASTPIGLLAKNLVMALLVVHGLVSVVLQSLLEAG